MAGPGRFLFLYLFLNQTMTSLTFYGGVDEIGGDKILFELVSGIDTQMFFPVHIEHPDVYRKISKNMTLIEGINYNF